MLRELLEWLRCLTLCNWGIDEWWFMFFRYSTAFLCIFQGTRDSVMNSQEIGLSREWAYRNMDFFYWNWCNKFRYIASRYFSNSTSKCRGNQFSRWFFFSKLTRFSIFIDSFTVHCISINNSANFYRAWFIEIWIAESIYIEIGFNRKTKFFLVLYWNCFYIAFC